jgi:hypothetical protein
MHGKFFHCQLASQLSGEFGEKEFSVNNAIY